VGQINYNLSGAGLLLVTKWSVGRLFQTDEKGTD